MSIPVIASIYAGVLALMLVVLSGLVIRQRALAKIESGDGGVAPLRGAIRAQANFTEYVPIALALLVLIDLIGFSPWVVHLLGAILIAGRLASAWGLLTNPEMSLGRLIGFNLTAIVLVVGGAMLIAAGWSGWRL